MPDPTLCVLTQHNDNGRTGAYLQETQLNTSNVNQNQFGHLFTYQVQGHIYAQPLYVNGIDIPGQGTHNVVYIATMHNTVYAFDADDPDAAISPLWARQLEDSVPLPDPNIGPAHQGQSVYRDIAREVGIVSTPVISLEHNALYVVAFTRVQRGYAHKLHALDLASGADLFGGPVQIAGNVPGTGYDNQNGNIIFAGNRQIQRAGLLLLNDVVYFAFASYGDQDNYHGWVFSYNAATLQKEAIYNTTRNGQRGGIWQAGQGLAADSDNHVYFMTGNGTYTNDGRDVSCTIVKLNANLSIADWFTPHNVADLNAHDADLGSSGVLLLPDTNLLIGGGKESKFYLMQRDKMGHFNAANDNQIVQSFYVCLPDDPHIPLTGNPAHTHNIHGGAVYWNGPNGPCIYIWTENDCLKVFRFDGTTFQTIPMSKGSTVSPGMPGGMLSISANGNTPGTGIVWGSHPFSNANQAVVSGMLHAYDAADLTNELWNSRQNAGRDDYGNFAKFCAPTIANGKVYVATFSDRVMVYGLLP